MSGGLPDSFLSRVSPEPNSGCWLWTGVVSKKGYGRFFIPESERLARGVARVVYAHREAYEALRGQIPDGLVIDHLCRVRCCVNPFHMEPVTSPENSRRGLSGVKGGERQLAKTHCPSGHEYNTGNTYRREGGSRHCRTCHREQVARKRVEARDAQRAAA